MTFLRSAAIVLAIVAMFQTPAAIAHSGGHKAINDQQALELAAVTIDALTSRDVGLGFGQLESSWKSLPDGSSRIHTKNKRYYVVSVEHAKEGRTLFILMSSGGEVYDANFTGEFSQLK